MTVLNTLLPILILIALGKALASIQFFGDGFFKDLNRLAYYFGLPALLIHELASAELWDPAGRDILFTLLAVIGLTILIAYLCVPIFRIPRGTIGAFVQGSFRGNLAFVGYPVIYFALGSEGLALGMVASGFCILVYNVSCVLILIYHGKQTTKHPFQTLWKHALSNPLILACAIGFGLNLLNLPLPLMLNRSLEALGQIALPMALIGLGAGLRPSDLQGRIDLSIIASLLNVAISPILGYFIGKAIGMDPVSLKITLIFLACPTAVFSYVLAEILHNDAVTARNIVILSTLLSILSLTVVIAII